MFHVKHRHPIKSPGVFQYIIVHDKTMANVVCFFPDLNKAQMMISGDGIGIPLVYIQKDSGKAVFDSFPSYKVDHFVRESLSPIILM